MRASFFATLRRLATVAGILLTAGAAGSRAEAQDLRDQYHQAPRDTVSQAVYDGWKQPGTIEKIYSYVKARSDGKMSPGRPARKAEG